MADQPPSVVVMEACGSAHFWAREIVKLGHEVKLIEPQYVRPFVKWQENDTADAEAIMIAAQRPEMCFVSRKSEEQQAIAVLFRVRERERLVHQPTELVNVLRAVLYEFGLIVPQGIGNIKRIDAILEEPNCDLPALVRIECADLSKHTAERTAKTDAKTIVAQEMAATAETVRRLQNMPGVGPYPKANARNCGQAPPVWLSVGRQTASERCLSENVKVVRRI